MMIKKIYGIILFTATIGMTSCTNEVENNVIDITNPNVTARRTLNMAAGNDGTRSTVSISNGNKWEVGDKFIAYNTTTPSGFNYLTAKDAGKQTRLEGEVECKKDDKIAVFFPLKYNYTGTTPGNVLISMQESHASENGNIVKKTQNGTLENIKYFDYSYGVAKIAVDNNKATGTVQMYKQYAVLNLKFTHNGTQIQNIKKLVISNVTQEALFNLKDSTFSKREKGSIVVVPTEARGEFDVAVFPDTNFSPTFTIETTDDKVYTLSVGGKNIQRAAYVPITLQVKENTPWVDINGTRWARYNLQYDPSVNNADWEAGYQLAKNPWDYFYTESYPLYPEGSELPGNFTTSKFDHFRWGDIVNAHNYSYSAHESYDKTMGNIQGQISGNKEFGDLAFYASKGKWRLPTRTDFENLMLNSAQYIGYYNDGTNDIIGVLFVPTNDTHLKGKVIDKNNQVIKASNTSGGVPVRKYTDSQTRLRQFTIEEINKGIFFPFAGIYNNYNDGSPKLSQPGNQAAYWTAEGNSRNNAQATAFTGYYRRDGQFLCPTVSSEGNKKNTKRSMYSIRPILVEN